jgi:hypothetical protein
MRELPLKVREIFSALNSPEPKPIPLMTLPYQIAQKLHGVSQRGSSRVRDLIDIQLIAKCEPFDLHATAIICRRLFKYRRMQSWPPRIVKGDDWDGIYENQKGDLSVAQSCDEAVSFVNEFVLQIDGALLS